MHHWTIGALGASLMLCALVSAGCSSHASELGHGGDRPAAADAGLGGGGATDGGAGGGGGNGGRGAGGSTVPARDASSGGVTSTPPESDASVTPGANPLCAALSCPADGGCPRIDVQRATTCQLQGVPSSITAVQTLTIGCGVIATLSQVQLAAGPFFQDIYDLRTGDLVGSRSSRLPNGPFVRDLQFQCSDSRPEVRREAVAASPWECPTAYRCVVCTSPPDMPTSDPACTPADFSEIAHLGSRSIPPDAGLHDGGA